MRLASLMIVGALAATAAAARAQALPAITIQRPDGLTLEVADSTMKRLAAWSPSSLPMDTGR